MLEQREPRYATIPINHMLSTRIGNAPYTANANETMQQPNSRLDTENLLKRKKKADYKIDRKLLPDQNHNLPSHKTDN